MDQSQMAMELVENVLSSPEEPNRWLSLLCDHHACMNLALNKQENLSPSNSLEETAPTPPWSPFFFAVLIRVY
jgi:hypothetical protein